MKYKSITKKYLINEYIKNLKTIKEIANQIGRSRCFIRIKLLKYKIRIRTNGEAHKGLSNLQYPQGYKSTYPTCEKCGKRLANRDAKLCREHFLDSIRGKKPHNYKGTKYRCIDCGKEITIGSKLGRCQSCGAKLRLSNINNKNKQLKALFKGMKLKPNKPEKALNALLNNLLPNEYKFVGNGKVLFDGFNPDFINCNGQKKIIELYGDYWHNRKEVKERDRRRLIAYKKYGYQTLIIWEREVKNIRKIKNRILEFNLNSKEQKWHK